MIDLQGLAFVDVETTGLDPAADRIAEIGVVTVDDDRVDVWGPSSRKSAEASPDSTRGRRLACAAARGRTDIQGYRRRARTTAGGPAPHRAQRALRLRLPESRVSRVRIAFDAQVLCTVMLSRRLYPQHAAHDLDALIERHGLCASETASCAARCTEPLGMLVRDAPRKRPRSDCRRARHAARRTGDAGAPRRVADRPIAGRSRVYLFTTRTTISFASVKPGISDLTSSIISAWIARRPVRWRYRIASRRSRGASRRECSVRGCIASPWSTKRRETVTADTDACFPGEGDRIDIRPWSSFLSSGFRCPAPTNSSACSIPNARRAMHCFAWREGTDCVTRCSEFSSPPAHRVPRAPTVVASAGKRKGSAIW